MYDSKSFKAMVDAVDSCRAKSHKQAVTYLQSNVRDFLRKKSESAKGNERKLYSQVYNLVSSYVDGLESGEAELADLKELVKDIRSAQTAYEEREF